MNKKKIVVFFFGLLFTTISLCYQASQFEQKRQLQRAVFNAMFLRPIIEHLHQSILTEYWCGPDVGCGGQSQDFLDINPKANVILIAFAETDTNGNVTFTLDKTMTINQFRNETSRLRAEGKKVMFSVGGQGAYWAGALASPQNFANSAFALIENYNLDGIDLDIESASLATAQQAKKLIILLGDLRNKFNSDKTKHLMISITPESTTVVKTVPMVGGGWNAMVPVVDLALQDIDFIQVQAYNDNPLGDKPGTAAFLVNLYEGWIAPFQLAQPDPVTGVSQCNGLPPWMLVLGIPASTKAANSQYYLQPEILGEALHALKARYGKKLGGVMLWDSHWDSLNHYLISNKAAEMLW